MKYRTLKRMIIGMLIVSITTSNVAMSELLINAAENNASGAESFKLFSAPSDSLPVISADDMAFGADLFEAPSDGQATAENTPITADLFGSEKQPQEKQPEENPIATNIVTLKILSEDIETKAYADDQEITGTLNEEGILSFIVETGKKLKLQFTAPDQRTFEVKKRNAETGQDEKMSADENGNYEFQVEKDEALTVTAEVQESSDPIVTPEPEIDPEEIVTPESEADPEAIVTPEPETDPDPITTNTVMLNLPSEDIETKGYTDNQEIEGTLNEEGILSFTVEDGKELILQFTVPDPKKLQVKRNNIEAGQEELLSADENGNYRLEINNDETLTITYDEAEEPELFILDSNAWQESFNKIFGLPIIGKLPVIGGTYRTASTIWSACKTIIGMKSNGLDLSGIQNSLIQLQSTVRDVQDSVNQLKIQAITARYAAFDVLGNNMNTYISNIIEEKKRITNYELDAQNKGMEYTPDYSVIYRYDDIYNIKGDTLNSFYCWLIGTSKCSGCRKTLLEEYYEADFRNCGNRDDALEHTKQFADENAALYILAVECHIYALNAEFEEGKITERKAREETARFLGSDGQMTNDGKIYQMFSKLDEQLEAIEKNEAGKFVDSNKETHTIKSFYTSICDGIISASSNFDNNRSANKEMISTLSPIHWYSASQNSDLEYLNKLKNYIATHYTEKYSMAGKETSMTVGQWLKNVVGVEGADQAKYLLIGCADRKRKTFPCIVLDSAIGNAQDIAWDEISDSVVLACAEKYDRKIDSCSGAYVQTEKGFFDFGSPSEAWRFLYALITDDEYVQDVTFTLRQDWIANTYVDGRTTFADDNFFGTGEGFKNGALKLDGKGNILINIAINLNGHTIDRNLKKSCTDGCILIDNTVHNLYIIGGDTVPGTLKGGNNASDASLIVKSKELSTTGAFQTSGEFIFNKVHIENVRLDANGAGVTKKGLSLLRFANEFKSVKNYCPDKKIKLIKIVEYCTLCDERIDDRVRENSSLEDL